MEAEFCLPRHLRANHIFSANYNRPPPIFVPTRFLKTLHPILSTHQNRVPMIIASGFHTNNSILQRFSHRRPSPHESFPWPPNALPAASAGDTRGRGDGDGDGTTWAWARSTATAALATTAVIIAAGVGLGGGIGLKGVRVVVDEAAMAGVMASTYPVWLNMPVGARAVQALLDISDDEAPTQEDFNQAKRKFGQQIRAKALIDYRELQEAVRVLIKSREAEKMIQALQSKFEDFCDADDKAQDAIEMGLILAEMQIYQGNYKEAITILHYSFYNAEMMTKDVRPDLYRVAANLMSGNKKEAFRSWEELKSKEDFMYPPTPNSEAGEEQRIPSSIQEFEAAVRKRRANILKARKSRPRSR